MAEAGRALNDGAQTDTQGHKHAIVRVHMRVTHTHFSLSLFQATPEFKLV